VLRLFGRRAPQTGRALEQTRRTWFSRLGGIFQRGLDDSADLAQLLHQIALGMKATGRVYDDHVDAAGLAGGDGIEGHGPRVGPLLVGHHLGPRPLGPLTELVDGRSAEGVGRTQ